MFKVRKTRSQLKSELYQIKYVGSEHNVHKFYKKKNNIGFQLMKTRSDQNTCTSPPPLSTGCGLKQNNLFITHDSGPDLDHQLPIL